DKLTQADVHNLFAYLQSLKQENSRCHRMPAVALFGFQLRAWGSSSQWGRDRDCFDFACDHLMVHDAATGKLAGRYRMQNWYRAKGNMGFYGEQFFDFSPFERMRGEVLELGRA